MDDQKLRSRLKLGIAAPAPVAGRVLAATRVRALGPRRPPLAAVMATLVAVGVVLAGGSLVIASLKTAGSPTSLRPLLLSSPSPSPAIGSPSPALSPTALPTSVPSPSNALPLVVLPTSAQVIPAAGTVVWASVAGIEGELLFRSGNQGTTWEQRTLPTTPGSARWALTFVDDTHGWYLQEGSPTTQCGDQRAGVWRTVDGAASWQNLGAAGIDLHQCKDNLSFVDLQTGFITAWDPNQRPVVYRTGNGGASWTPSRVLPDPPGQTTSAGGFALRPGQVRRFGTKLLVDTGGWQHRYVYQSHDGGATWTYLASVPGSTDVDEVSFLDASHWWLSGPGLGPNYRYTADGGVNYTAAPGAPDSAAPVSPVFTFAGLKIGYATVRGTMWRTTDGGMHWTAVRTPGT